MKIEIYSKEDDFIIQMDTVKYFADNELTGANRKVIADALDVKKNLTDSQIKTRIKAWINQENLFEKFPNRLKMYQAWSFLENIKTTEFSELTTNQQNNLMKILAKLAQREIRNLDLGD